jgi:hypothetical protein
LFAELARIGFAGAGFFLFGAAKIHYLIANSAAQALC